MSQHSLKAAQYLRMSTEHQRYSIANQVAAIGVYAEDRRMSVVQTYSDRGRSGLQIAGRPGLAKLIQDVLAGSAEFSVILVYDVSRWGRFQDADESAHYEFICRQAGMSVHYCAETFENEGGLASGLMKSIKRLMAGEYSRELSVKVTAACRRASTLGYKQGGKAGYGLRRWVVSEDGKLKGELAYGETKAMQGDRVTLRPGPSDEIALVLRIYRMFVKDRISPTHIGRILSAEGLLSDLGRPWTYFSVLTILKSETYIGNHVYGRASLLLRQQPRRINEPSTWVRADGAFEGIVPRATWLAAQKMLARGTRTHARRLRINESIACVSDEAMLDVLRALLSDRGYLSINMLNCSAGMPSPSTYIRRFGSIDGAFKLAGYERPDAYKKLYFSRRKRLKFAAVVDGLLAALKETNTQCEHSPFADVVVLDQGLKLQIQVSVANAIGNVHVWCFTIHPIPSADFSVVARIEQNGVDVLDYIVISKDGVRPGNHQTSRTCGKPGWPKFRSAFEVAEYLKDHEHSPASSD